MLAYTAGAPELLRARRSRRALRLPERRHGRPLARSGDERALDPEGPAGRQGRDPLHRGRGHQAQRPERPRLRRRRPARVHRSRHLQPGRPRPELHLRPRPGRHAERRRRLRRADVSRTASPSRPTARSSGTSPIPATSGASVPTARSRISAACPATIPILDGMKIGADGRIYVTDLVGKGIHVLRPDGTVEGFIPVGGAPTNCAFDGEMLWVTDATVLAAQHRAELRRPALAAAHSRRRLADPQGHHRPRGPAHEPRASRSRASPTTAMSPSSPAAARASAARPR